MLAADSWRVAVNADADSADRLMQHLAESGGRSRRPARRVPMSLSARLDRACVESSLPEAVIAALLGVTAAEMWDIRNRGVIPPGAVPRVRAFAELAGETEREQTVTGNELAALRRAHEMFTATTLPASLDSRMRRHMTGYWLAPGETNSVPGQAVYRAAVARSRNDLRAAAAVDAAVAATVESPPRSC